MIALNPRTPQRFVLQSDRKKSDDDPTKTVFHFRDLSHEARLRLADMSQPRMSLLGAEQSYLSGPPQGSRIQAIAMDCLFNVTGFVDSSGSSIPFESQDKRDPYAPPTNDFLGRFSLDALREFVDHVWMRTQLSEDERGKPERSHADS